MPRLVIPSLSIKLHRKALDGASDRRTPRPPLRDTRGAVAFANQWLWRVTDCARHRRVQHTTSYKVVFGTVVHARRGVLQAKLGTVVRMTQ
eukprot:m.18885 g.18885  ORF g.18885 m.18885 type:complete len:91 (-) comp11609_c1_seq1:28-300(-)